MRVRDLEIIINYDFLEPQCHGQPLSGTSVLPDITVAVGLVNAGFSSRAALVTMRPSSI